MEASYPRVEPRKPAPPQYFLWACFFVLIGLFVIGVIGPYLIPYSPHAARKTACFSNLKQQGLALAEYAESADGCLPPGNRWMDVIAPQIRGQGIFHCPEVPHDEFGYALSSQLAGKPIPSKDHAAQTPLAFDSRVTIRNATGTLDLLPNPPRHGQKDIVVYSDGHAKAYPLN